MRDGRKPSLLIFVNELFLEKTIVLLIVLIILFGSPAGIAKSIDYSTRCVIGLFNMLLRSAVELLIGFFLCLLLMTASIV